LAKFKSNQILLNKISQRFLLKTNLLIGWKILIRSWFPHWRQNILSTSHFKLWPFCQPDIYTTVVAHFFKWSLLNGHSVQVSFL
jgi:hypothetical protein